MRTPELRWLKQLEDETAEARGRLVARPRAASGCHPPTNLGSGRRHKLEDVREHRVGSIRRACQVLEMETSTYHCRPRRKGMSTNNVAVPLSVITFHLSALSPRLWKGPSQAAAITSLIAAAGSHFGYRRSRIATIASHVTTTRSRVTTAPIGSSSLFLAAISQQTDRLPLISQVGSGSRK